MRRPEEFLEPHRGPGVSEEEFSAFEAAFRVTLPEDMKAFYREQNGGFFREGREFFVREDEYELPLAEFHAIARTFHPHVSTIDTLLQWQQADGFLPRNLLPFCSDQSGGSYCILTGNGDNRVYFLFYEECDEFLKNPEECQVAESFTDFLEKIHVR